LQAICPATASLRNGPQADLSARAQPRLVVVREGLAGKTKDSHRLDDGGKARHGLVTSKDSYIVGS
jgi:hypothetical protein